MNSSPATATAAAVDALYWAAPANLDRIKSGASSWGIYVTEGREIALPLNHYAIGVWNRQPGGRTAGRALRACRRWLRRSPIRFDADMVETYSTGNRADRRLLKRWLNDRERAEESGQLL